MFCMRYTYHAIIQNTFFFCDMVCIAICHTSYIIYNQMLYYICIYTMRQVLALSMEEVNHRPQPFPPGRPPAVPPAPPSDGSESHNPPSAPKPSAASGLGGSGRWLDDSDQDSDGGPGPV
jgi:hypothetical protein